MRLKPLTLILLAPVFSGAHEITLEPTHKDAAFRFDPCIEITAKVEPASASTGATGTLQALVPITQSDDASDLWFAHAQAHYRGSTETQYLEASLGLGAGYRMQLDSEFQIGAYGLLDLRLGATKEKYYLFTPGIEVQTPLWRVSLNGYLPLGKHASSESKAKWGHEHGIETYHRFEGHSEVDRLFQKGEYLPIGLDLNGSWHFNEQLSLSVGGYYMKYGEDARPGARIGVAYTFAPNFQFEAQAQKDTQDTQLSLQLRTSLGGTTETDRLMTSIQRPLMPLVTNVIPVSDKQKVQPYIAFYHSNGSGSEATFEKPAGPMLKQSDIDAMPDKAVIYLASPGEYSLDTSTTTNGIDGHSSSPSFLQRLNPWSSQQTQNTSAPVKALVLNNKSLLGRTADFKAADYVKMTDLVQGRIPYRNPKNAVHLRFPLHITGQGTAEKPMRIGYFVHHHNLLIYPENMLLVDQAEHVQIKSVYISDSMRRNGFKINRSHHISLHDFYLGSFEHIPLTIESSNTIEIQSGNIYTSWRDSVGNLTGIQLSKSKNIDLINNYFYIRQSSSGLSMKGLDLGTEVTDSKVQGNTFTLIQEVHTNLSHNAIGYPQNAQLLGIHKLANDATEIKDNRFIFETHAPSGRYPTIQTQQFNGTTLNRTQATRDPGPNGAYIAIHRDDKGNTFTARWKN